VLTVGAEDGQRRVGVPRLDDIVREGARPTLTLEAEGDAYLASRTASATKRSFTMWSSGAV